MQQLKLEFINATTDHNSVIAEMAQKIWPVVYKNIITEEQIIFMLGEMYSETALKEQMQQNQKFIILEIDTVPVGFVSYSATEQPQTCKINKLYLLPDQHGKGLGKKLIDVAETAIGKEGYTEIILNVNRKNEAVGFYRQCGYAISEEADLPIGPFWMNDYIMKKRLT